MSLLQGSSAKETCVVKERTNSSITGRADFGGGFVQEPPSMCAMFGAVRCDVVQCGAVWCSVVQCGAVWCSVVQWGAVCCSAVQCGAVCCSALPVCALFGATPAQGCSRKKCPIFEVISSGDVT